MKTLANMFDYKSVPYVPSKKPSAAKVEDSILFQKAARSCNEHYASTGQINQLRSRETDPDRLSLENQMD